MDGVEDGAAVPISHRQQPRQRC
jgi:hypothetical protein